MATTLVRRPGYGASGMVLGSPRTMPLMVYMNAMNTITKSSSSTPTRAGSAAANPARIMSQLTDEKAEGGRPHDRQGAEEQDRPCHRQAGQNAPDAIRPASAVGKHQGPACEKYHGLSDRVIQGMQQSSVKPEHSCEDPNRSQ